MYFDLNALWAPIFLSFFVLAQILYFASFLVDVFFFSRARNIINMGEASKLGEGDFPMIVMFYPVLNELESTMRTTLTSIGAVDYPRDRYRVIAIPNQDDHQTVASLQHLAREFAFLEIIEVPPTTHPSWQVVWDAWDENTKSYWWHSGERAHNRDLPPKKTRQLIYSFYRTHSEGKLPADYLLNYIDADSAIPRDHFLGAAVGIRRYDVIQATNVAGNLNVSMAASWHSFDHMTWDGRKYAHLSADGKQPFWVLGKGLFVRGADVHELGSFHPWLTIEDPEVGMRFWKNGRRLGILESPLIEEVPHTLGQGITQRKRWVAGFFQSLTTPLTEMGFTGREKVLAWLNFMPCLSLGVNILGIPVGAWAIYMSLDGRSVLPDWSIWFAAVNLSIFLISLALLYVHVWRRTALVLERRRDRIWYLVRVNPLSVMLWWTIWTIPLWIGWRMYRRGDGLVWERTEKIDANAALVRTSVKSGHLTGLVPTMHDAARA